ncbi:hypothetical protein K1719_025613 [Acacia pycnantha]|nr:hypothetical protein K1719_025613 [Acacia pycnantha]
MANLKDMREAHPSAPSNLHGLATILAIGTANPSAFIYQRDFPDLHLRLTNSHHLPHLKAKLQRLCEKSMIEKRHVYLTEDILKENPKLCAYDEPSLDARQDMVEKAASKAIDEWGRPKSDITHLIFCSSFCGIEILGADHKLIKLEKMRRKSENEAKEKPPQGIGGTQMGCSPCVWTSRLDH